jgi:integral membrane protein
VRAVATALTRYRVMAYIVGVLLVVLFAAWGVELTAAHGSTAHHVGELVTMYLGIAHGWLYMLFLVMAALLARRARWPLGFTALTLLLGTVPVLSFLGERRATARVRAQMAAEPEREHAGSSA